MYEAGRVDPPANFDDHANPPPTRRRRRRRRSHIHHDDDDDDDFGSVLSSGVVATSATSGLSVVADPWAERSFSPYILSSLNSWRVGSLGKEMRLLSDIFRFP